MDMKGGNGTSEPASFLQDRNVIFGTRYFCLIRMHMRIADPNRHIRQIKGASMNKSELVVPSRLKL